MTTISANGFIGGPGWAYTSGMSAYMLQFCIPLCLLVAAVYFIPFFYNLGVTSTYQYVTMRFGKGSAAMAVFGFMVGAICQVSSMVFIPSLFVQQLTGWSLSVIVPILVFVVIIYTIAGGIKAVIWTDAIQMAVLWTGLIATIVVALGEMNVGFFEVMETAKLAGKFNALNFSLDIGLENGVWVAFFGGFIMWGQYYSSDQAQVQRALACKTVTAAKVSMVASAFVMNVMYFIFMIIGMIMFSFYQGQEFVSSNDIMIDFILNHLPVGIVGLMIAAVFAAGMSSIDSILNSMTTVFTKDIYEPYFAKDGKPATMKHTLTFTAVFGVIIIMVTLMGFSGTTSSVLATVGSYISYVTGSVFAIFILGVFTKKANDIGVVAGFIAGILANLCLSGTSVNWLWYNMVGTVVATAVGYAVSCMFSSRAKDVDYDKYTYLGQRKAMLAQGADPESVPGTVGKMGIALVVFFVVQFVILMMFS